MSAPGDIGRARDDKGQGAVLPAAAGVRHGPMSWLAALRLLLLPIVFAGDRLVAHPRVGTAGFNAIFAVACVYALAALIASRRPRATPPLWLFASLDLLAVCALTYESGGAFSQLHWAFLFLPLGAAILLDPRRTAQVSALTTLAYLVVALVHPSTHAQQLDLVTVQTLYIAWVGVAAVVLSGLLARRQAHIVELAAERGSLVAQALAAEDGARRRLADALHDSAMQNLLSARQDLAEARAGEHDAVQRAEQAVRLAIEQLRTTIRDLHPYVLEQLGVQTALETLGEQYAARGGYRLEAHVDPHAAGVCDQLVVSLARELLANAALHAAATHVTLRLDAGPRTIALTVSDDGRGFDQHQLAGALREGHIGLASCRERVQAIQGRFEIDSHPGTGTTVHCEIPRLGLASVRLSHDGSARAALAPTLLAGVGADETRSSA